MSTWTPEFFDCVSRWKNEDEFNVHLHTAFANRVDATEYLKRHRDWVEQNQFGFGDRAFHWAYHLLVDQMPSTFSFLEIGVFKGQVLSLVAYLAKHSEKNAICFGVTTLAPTPDERCRYPDGDYVAWIKRIHDHFGVPQPELIVGKSNEPSVIQRVQLHEYDAMLIDGGHDYKDVVDDIKNFAGCVRVGGFLLCDDASIGRLNIGHLWPGLEDVARAVKDVLDPDPRFRFLFAVGHLNIFERIK